MINIERDKLIALIQEHRNAHQQHMTLAVANDGAAQALEALLQEYDDQEAVSIDDLLAEAQLSEESAMDEAA